MTNKEIKAYMKHIGRLRGGSPDHDSDTGKGIDAAREGMYVMNEGQFKLYKEAFKKMKELEKGLEDLEDILNDAYTLNDFCLNKVILNQSMSECECIAESFSLKVMQNLSWLLGVIKRSDEDEKR